MIVVVNSGCDQCMVGCGFVVVSRTKKRVSMMGPLQGRSMATPLKIVTAETKLKLTDGREFIMRMNKTLQNPDVCQVESLLQPHQMREFGVISDDIPSTYQGLVDQVVNVCK